MHVLVKDKEERTKTKKICNIIFYSNDHSLLSHKWLIGSFRKTQMIWKLPIRQQQGTKGKKSVQDAKEESNKIFSKGRYQYDKWNIKKKKKSNATRCELLPPRNLWNPISL